MQLNSVLILHFLRGKKEFGITGRCTGITRLCPPLAALQGAGLCWHGEEAMSIGRGPGHLCCGTPGSWDEAKAGSCSGLGGCSPLAELRQPGGRQCNFSHQPKAPALPTAFVALLCGAKPCLGQKQKWGCKIQYQLLSVLWARACC